MSTSTPEEPQAVCASLPAEPPAGAGELLASVDTIRAIEKDNQTVRLA